MDNSRIHWLSADWPAPAHVHAGTTTREGGVSQGVYASFNLADHVGDDSTAVLQNRQLLRHDLALPDEPCWLKQIHGNTVIDLFSGVTPETADGSYSHLAGRICTVLTADCLPLLLCNRRGTEIAAVHVGWRGFCANIIERALDKFTCRNSELLAWLGPAISARHYETGQDVYTACLGAVSDAESAFTATRPGHWLTNLPKLVCLQLQQAGVYGIYGGNRCTFSEPEHFFSYRRDGNTGRFASLIWMDC